MSKKKESKNQSVHISPPALLELDNARFSRKVAALYGVSHYTDHTAKVIERSLETGARSRIEILVSLIRILKATGVPFDIDGHFPAEQLLVDHPDLHQAGLHQANLHHPDLQQPSIHHQETDQLDLPEPDHRTFFYRITDFDPADDDRFIELAYLRILKRKADPPGKNKHLDSLRSGRRDPVEVLGSLRFGKEGRQIGVKIRGLAVRFVLFKLSRLFPFSIFARPVLAFLEFDRARIRMARMTALHGRRERELLAMIHSEKQKHNLEMNLLLQSLSHQNRKRSK